jgi:hypothetical protein
MEGVGEHVSLWLFPYQEANGGKGEDPGEAI